MKKSQLEEIIKKIKSAGIPTDLSLEDDSTANTAALSFQLNELRNELLFLVDPSESPWEFNLKLLDLDKSKKQILLCLQEPARKMTKHVDSKFFSDRDITNKNDLRNLAISHSRIPWFSAAQKETVRNIQISRTPDSQGYRSIKAEVTRTSPESREYFLIGFDEDHMFISNIPKAAKTIKQAIKNITPPGLLTKNGELKAGVLRQGEFFFVPLNATEMKQLTSLSNKDALHHYSHNEEANFERSSFTIALEKEDDTSDHYYTNNIQDVFDTKLNFITGIVLNARHKPLVLNGWYKVVNNLEKESADSWD